MAIKHHNYDYLAGPTFPEAVGDRFYAQDIFRDFHFSLDNAGRKIAGAYETFPVLIKDSAVKKGTLWTDLDIPIARGIVEYEVDVPLSYAALPPTVTQEDIYVRIETAAETDFDISGTATLDGVTVNYIKVTYNETDGSSRTRAKKAGTYVYEKAVSYTITVDAVAPTNKDLVLGEVVGDGAASLVITPYTRTRHLNAAYDYVVETQEDFNVLIDYTAANQYRIKDDVKSVYVKYLSGGYQMTGATSPLQEGDSYGYIETNDCTRIVFEPGAFIDMHQNIGYIEVDTDYCYLDGVSVQGDKGAASAIARSFLLNANYVTFMNCDSQTRLSNAASSVFEGSGTASHNQTSTYINCKVFDYDSSAEIIIMENCQNVQNINVQDIECTGIANLYILKGCQDVDGVKIIQIDHSSATGGNIDCIYDCTNISNVYIYDIDAVGTSASLECFYNCYNCENIKIEDVDADYLIRVFELCRNVSNVIVTDIESASDSVRGFVTSYNLSNCRISSMDADNGCVGFYQSDYISTCEVDDLDNETAGDAFGFYLCNNISACYCSDIDSTVNNYHGFYDCTQLSSCYATTCEDGFNACKQIAGCKSESNDNNGFMDCNRIVGSLATGNGNDGFEDCNVISGTTSSANTGNGYDGCKNMTANRSNGNTAANYNNSFADFAGTQACADTAAGGYNS